MIVITQLDGGEEMNTKVGFEKKKKEKPIQILHLIIKITSVSS